MSRKRVTLSAAALTALATGLLASPAAFADECEGGVTGPVKPVLHVLEEPLEPTGLDGVVHTVECSLP